MKIGKQKIRLIKEEEKIRQGTHWDLDYLPKDEILDLYEREKDHPQKEHGIAHASQESDKKLSLLLIATGLLLLAVALCAASSL